MSLDCAELHACADLLHETAAAEMAEAQREGSLQPRYVERLRKVIEIEEVAAAVEVRMAETC